MPNQMANRLCKLYKGTKAELALEPAVAALGRCYRWQFPLWLFDGRLRFFPDLVLLYEKIVIEVDGDSHKSAKAQAKDAERTALLEAAGWRVFRCRNEEAISDPYGVVERLKQEMGL